MSDLSLFFQDNYFNCTKWHKNENLCNTFHLNQAKIYCTNYQFSI
jgi:hypothetical protein